MKSTMVELTPEELALLVLIVGSTSQASAVKVAEEIVSYPNKTRDGINRDILEYIIGNTPPVHKLYAKLLDEAKKIQAVHSIRFVFEQ